MNVCKLEFSMYIIPSFLYCQGTYITSQENLAWKCGYKEQDNFGNLSSDVYYVPDHKVW